MRHRGALPRLRGRSGRHPNAFPAQTCLSGTPIEVGAFPSELEKISKGYSSPNRFPLNAAPLRPRKRGSAPRFPHPTFGYFTRSPVCVRFGAWPLRSFRMNKVTRASLSVRTMLSAIGLLRMEVPAIQQSQDVITFTFHGLVLGLIAQSSFDTLNSSRNSLG